MLAIQFDAPYASPVQWADVLGNEAAARVHVESPGRFVRWVEVRAMQCTHMWQRCPLLRPETVVPVNISAPG